MRRKQGSFRSGPPSRWLRRAGLVVIVLVLLGIFYGCVAQSIVYSSRGTMIFVPEGVWF